MGDSNPMKSTLEELTAAEKKALAHFYGTSAYDVLKKLCHLEIEGLGKDALGSPNHEQTKFYSGQAVMAAKLPKLIRELHKETEKNRKK